MTTVRSATSSATRWFGALPLFDPRKGITVLEPPGAGKGWWVGAPSAIYEAQARKFYLYYRVRKPREFGRGGECRIASSDDGVRFRWLGNIFSPHPKGWDAARRAAARRGAHRIGDPSAAGVPGLLRRQRLRGRKLRGKNRPGAEP